MEPIIRVLIVDDDADFIYLLRKYLEKQGDIQIVGQSRNGESVIPQIYSKRPDIVLVDLHLGRSPLDGIRLSRRIRVETDAKTLILTGLNDYKIIQAAFRETFASGYIFKNQLSLLTENIRAIAAGTTAQEYMMVCQALSVLSDSEKTAFQMMMGQSISLKSAKKTISNQKRAVLKKLGMSSQKELRHVFQIFLDENP